MSNGIFPAVGKSGEFKMLMYRGDRAQENRLHADFASDAGDYGRGEYWANKESYAQTYGIVRSKEVCLKNALHMSPKDIIVMAREYRTTCLEDGREERLLAAGRLAEDMKKKGYDGIVSFGYEMPGIWGACIF